MMHFSKGFPAQLDQLAAIGAMVKDAATTLPAADPSMFAYEVELAVHEAVVNIIEHAYQDGVGPLVVDILIWDNSIQISLIDKGRSFDPLAVPAPNLSVPQEGGYGLFLIDQLMDSAAYHSREGKNYLILTKSAGQNPSQDS